jgi:hypothetical protein
MKRFIFFLSICCIFFLSGMQNADAKSGNGWEKYFGAKATQEVANDICSLTDGESGGYVVVGYKQVDPNYRKYGAYILVMDSMGTVKCQLTYRGPNNDQDCFAYSVARYYDGYDTYFMVTGTIYNNDGGQDIFLVKYKLQYPYTLKKVAENTCLGGNDFNTAYKIKKVGYQNHFVLVGKTDDEKLCVLEVRGQDCYFMDAFILDKPDEISYSVGYSMCEINSHYYVCGQAVMNDGNEQVVWLDLTQNDQWFTLWMTKYFGGSYSDAAYAIAPGYNNNSMVMVGQYGQSANNSDYWILTVNSSGIKDPSSSCTWGETNQNNEALTSVDVKNNGDLVIAGRTLLQTTSTWRYNAYLGGADSYAHVHWHNYYGGSQDVGNSFVRTTGKVNYIALATAAVPGTIGNGDVYVLRYSIYK